MVARVKIAFVSTVLHFPWGGADTLWTRAAEAAAARGDSLFLSLSPLTAAHPRIRALLAAGATLDLRTPTSPRLSLADRTLRKLGRPTPTADRALADALEKFAPDLVVFSHGGAYDLLQFPAVLAALRRRHMSWRAICNWQAEHPLLNADDLERIREAFASADLIAFVSTRNLAITRRHLLLPLPNAVVVHNPLRWSPADVSSWPAAPEARLATVSRLDSGKGIHLLLHALAEANPSLPPWRLQVFGHGPQENELRALVAHLALGDRVAFRGHVGSLREIWADNHLLCAPAIDDGVPMTLPEALLCERPVLSTRVGGAEDWITPQETGYLCPAATVPFLAEALAHALADHAHWPAFGAAARPATLARYRPDDYLRLIA